MMLLEEGFEVVSVDASDKMLKYALKERWNRRTEPAFNNWSKWMEWDCDFGLRVVWRCGGKVSGVNVFLKF